MSKIAISTTKGLLYLSQITPFRGLGGYSGSNASSKSNAHQFPQAETEANDAGIIESYFDDLSIEDFISGKKVLDLGSGYGGRTVEYAKYAKSVVGIEPFDSMVALSGEYASSRNANNCTFKVCTEEIPLDDASVDVVFCYDVLEHVRDPRDTMSEINRVLRPGGRAVIIFPPYFGALSHHLDYISGFPALHLMFSPSTLITAVNEILASDYGKKFGTNIQPEPKKNYLQDRYVLPTLNGLTSDEFRKMCSRYKIEEFHETIYFSRRLPSMGKLLYLVSRLFRGRMREFFSSKICVILTKA